MNQKEKMIKLAVNAGISFGVNLNVKQQIVG